MLERSQSEVPVGLQTPAWSPCPKSAEQGAEIPLFFLPSEDKKKVGERSSFSAPVLPLLMVILGSELCFVPFLRYLKCSVQNVSGEGLGEKKPNNKTHKRMDSAHF